MDNPFDPERQEAERKRIVRSRNRVLAVLLVGLIVLFYFITIAKMMK